MFFNILERGLEHGSLLWLVWSRGAETARKGQNYEKLKVPTFPLEKHNEITDGSAPLEARKMRIIKPVLS